MLLAECVGFSEFGLNRQTTAVAPQPLWLHSLSVVIFVLLLLLLLLVLSPSPLFFLQDRCFCLASPRAVQVESKCTIAFEFSTREKGGINFGVTRFEGISCEQGGGDGGEQVTYLPSRKYQAHRAIVGAIAKAKVREEAEAKSKGTPGNDPYSETGMTAIRKQYLFIPGTYEFK